MILTFGELLLTATAQCISQLAGFSYQSGRDAVYVTCVYYVRSRVRLPFRLRLCPRAGLDGNCLMKSCRKMFLYSATRGSMEKCHSRALDLYAYILVEISIFMSLNGHTFHLALCTPFVT